ncbi:MAG TPA: hypothetical protein VIW68_13655 [Candidatus Sulfotelmatobacter sp.]
MSSPDDHQDPPKTLPSPELNPLVNPVLGRNMGRWAEVYFTSPPEKREQAVQALLRELERESPMSEPAADTTSGSSETSHPAEESGTPSATFLPATPLPEEFIQCGACGHVALAEQKFCGTCGVPLLTPEPERIGEETFGGMKPDPQPAPVVPILRDTLGWDRNEQAVGEELPTLFLDQKSGRNRRSRKLTAVALAILGVTLFYVGARETTAWLRTHAAPQAATTASAEDTNRSLPEPAAKSENAAQTGADRASAAAPTALPAAKVEQRTNPARARNSADPASPEKALTPVNGEGKLNPHADHVGSGAEELAIAESYLSGTQGKARDSSQAAQWLWKSVARQNAVAALLLSDLYVTGDGVPQNCDQARLLLDAAARKRTPGAGARIRDLPNMGCR